MFTICDSDGIRCKHSGLTSPYLTMRRRSHFHRPRARLVQPASSSPASASSRPRSTSPPAKALVSLTTRRVRTCLTASSQGSPGLTTSTPSPFAWNERRILDWRVTTRIEKTGAGTEAGGEEIGKSAADASYCLSDGGSAPAGAQRRTGCWRRRRF
jgi:hypothetical protein